MSRDGEVVGTIQLTDDMGSLENFPDQGGRDSVIAVLKQAGRMAPVGYGDEAGPRWTEFNFVGEEPPGHDSILELLESDGYEYLITEPDDEG